MKWFLLLFIALSFHTTDGQRWLETVILTQQGPISYAPTIQNTPQGYFTADVFPVDITNENHSPSQNIAWPVDGNTFEVPVFSGVRVKQPSMIISKVIPPSHSVKRKKHRSKKNGDQLKQQSENLQKSSKIIINKPKLTLELPLDPRTNENDLNRENTYPQRGRRFVNRGNQPKHSENILKGQAIDYTRSQETENLDPYLRYNEQSAQSSDLIPAIYFPQNGYPSLPYSYFTYQQPYFNEENKNKFYGNNLWY